MPDIRPCLIVRRLGSLTKPPCLVFRICRQLVSEYGDDFMQLTRQKGEDALPKDSKSSRGI